MICWTQWRYRETSTRMYYHAHNQSTTGTWNLFTLQNSEVLTIGMVLIFVQVSDASIEGSGRFHCIHTSMRSKLISKLLWNSTTNEPAFNSPELKENVMGYSIRVDQYSDITLIAPQQLQTLSSTTTLNLLYSSVMRTSIWLTKLTCKA